ncbi:MAG: rod shape-determining protein MreC [Candidatus Nealsonbacteria bacterium CG_4_10_14_0_2_um_filter_38_17]|uniref:Cell shape-determining protein MreC n=2 Tax=Candidatus Nealsoniibacteriota TaxID=1817911 RepID=A0A2M7UYX2_9BACT|nr:MAG: rod shape-determining protein MreC [Candidatus Nealsonbacteria bacterium CG23_combo_of_CG06-09_8_20_14_all_38_19]PIZ89174.1 MAG: rod shape-determining protein MreC [Candidatus Nealsonbacteria bacterium CG_4_10_14_0_2_um_filter_38_17]
MKSSSGLKKVVLLVVLISIIFVFNRTGFSKKVKNLFYLISAPIQRQLWQAGNSVSDFFETIFEIKNLKKENEELKSKNLELSAENSVLKEVQKDNESLRQALGVGLEKDLELILVHITGKDLSKDSIFINKGKKDGVEKGLPVITSQKVLVGKVGEAYDNFSEVILIYNKESSFDAKIQDKNVSGLIKGKGNLQLLLDLIPLDKEISAGDIVVTSALSGDFPEGILVGKVKSVKKNELEPFQQAEIIPSFDFKEIDQLFIIQGIK